LSEKAAVFTIEIPILAMIEESLPNAQQNLSHAKCLLLFITFIQGIYNCVPETNHVSRVYSVAAVLY
jgi:hypothetical protein